MMVAEWKKSEKIKKLKKYATRDNFIIAALVGILLLVIAIPDKSRESKEGAVFGERGESGESESVQMLEGGEDTRNYGYGENYAQALEKRLEEILSRVDGVGEVKVMVTLVSTEEVVIEKNENVSEASTKEKDSGGGERTISQTERNVTTVNEKNGTYESPFIKKTILPKLEGVLVVAKGCGNGVVDKKITEMIRAVTGLEAHKIIVAKMR